MSRARVAVLIALCMAGCSNPHVVEVHECRSGPYFCESASDANSVHGADHVGDMSLIGGLISEKRVTPISVGTRVTVIDERQDYAVQVRLPDGRTGWILRECVRELK